MDGFQHFFWRFLLHNVTLGPRPQSALGVERFIMHGKNQDGGFKGPQLHVFDQTHSARVAQRNIQYHEIGLENGDGLQGLMRRGGLSA